MHVGKASKHTYKKKKSKKKIKMHAHITTNQQAQQRSFLTACFQCAQTYAARSHSVWPAGIIKIHYRAMRWRLIPDDFKCVEGVNSGKLSQELLDVQIIPLLSRAGDKSGVAVGQKAFDNGTRWSQ